MKFLVGVSVVNSPVTGSLVYRALILVTCLWIVELLPGVWLPRTFRMCRVFLIPHWPLPRVTMASEAWDPDVHLLKTLEIF